MLGGRHLAVRLARRFPGGHEQHPVQIELDERLIGGDEVTVVDRVERPAHDAESESFPHSRI